MRFFVAVLLLSSALVLGNSQLLNAKTSDPETIVPFKADIDHRAGKDWTVITVELPPGTINSWHSQPQGEFLYVLEGEGRLEVDGKRAVTLNAGSVSTLTSIPHHLLKNTSRTKTLKILVVFLNDKNEPHPLLAARMAQETQKEGHSFSNGQSKPRLEQKSPGIGLIF